MDLQCFRSRSRLKFRRAPSYKSSSSQSSSSLHGSSRQIINQKGCINMVRQPLIFHTFDPEIIVAEPAEFMCVVQRLTGSLHTRRSLRSTMMQKMEAMQVSMQVTYEKFMEGDVQPTPQSINEDPLKEGSTVILAPSCPNPLASELISEAIIKQAPELPVSSPANTSEVSANNLPNCEHETSLSTTILPAKEISEEVTNTGGGGAPWSPVLSLTTSSEGYHTDNLSREGKNTVEAEEEEEDGSSNFFVFSGGSSYKTAEEEAEEDGSSSFFVFSGDCYYGNYKDGAYDDLELRLL